MRDEGFGGCEAGQGMGWDGHQAESEGMDGVFREALWIWRGGVFLFLCLEVFICNLRIVEGTRISRQEEVWSF